MVPQQVREASRAKLPISREPLNEVYSEARDRVLLYSVGNIHLRFWISYMGAGTFTAAMGEFLASIRGRS